MSQKVDDIILWEIRELRKEVKELNKKVYGISTVVSICTALVTKYALGIFK